MDDKQELRRRRQAIRLRLQGVSHKIILEKVQRSRAWLSKWQKRFEQQGASGLRTHSRRPHHTPGACSLRIARLIVQTRRRLVKQKVGLRGARAIRHELRKVLDKRTPSLTTINRVLQKRHLVSIPSEASPAYFPKPLMTIDGILHALDWTCRYLEDGFKVYAFHTLNLRTRANHCGRQKQRHRDPAWSPDLENPGNPAIFAARQRCRLLWRLQGAAHLRAVCSTVFVFWD